MKINPYIQGKPLNNNKFFANVSYWRGRWNGLDQTIRFDSAKEMHRFNELRMLERTGVISGLELQKTFELIPKQPGERAASCRVDFFYYLDNGKAVVEEVKSPRTAKEADYILRRKLFKLKYTDIEHRELI